MDEDVNDLVQAGAEDGLDGHSTKEKDLMRRGKDGGGGWVRRVTTVS